jgi:hypothetical protein
MEERKRKREILQDGDGFYQLSRRARVRLGINNNNTASRETPSIL